MKYKFGDIAINSTAKKKPEENDKFHYIGLEHLDPGNLIVQRYGADTAPIGEKLIMKKGDVLFGKRRAYQKKVAIAPFDGIFSAHGMVLRPNESIVTKAFFPFFISSDAFLNEAIRISVGSLSPTINWRDLKELEFDLPSLEEQERLAKVLWAAYDLKESYKKLIAATDEMVKAQFVEMFGEPMSVGKIKDIVDTNIFKARSKFKPKDIIKYIDISSIDNKMNIIISNTSYYFKDAPSRAQQHIKKGDILISTVRPNLKNIALNESDEENLVASSGYCILRPKYGYANYLLAIVLSDRFTIDMTKIAKGTNYPAIHDYDILNYKICIPKDTDAKLFSTISHQADKSKQELQQSIDKIDKVIKSLLPE